jgi:hypothetical protein
MLFLHRHLVVEKPSQEAQQQLYLEEGLEGGALGDRLEDGGLPTLGHGQVEEEEEDDLRHHQHEEHSEDQLEHYYCISIYPVD